jgi:hypothetical protein
MNPSNEQQKIINSIVEEKSVVVNAVAGSGKTTTLIFIAQKLKNKKILQITYNKQLKNEVREKIAKNSLTNVKVHTYHGLCVAFYDNTCYTDEKMIEIIKNDTPLTCNYEIRYDVIVIDETQDMTQSYFELLCKFMRDIRFAKTLLILGDSYQSVYDFKNADSRYLLLAQKIWNKDFNQLTLNESYRVTSHIASFVNKIMIGYDRIVSHKKSQNKVFYYRTNPHNTLKEFYDKIKSFLDNGYTPQDIFILSPSLKSADSPCKKLENILVSNNIPVYFTRNEEEGIDENVMAQKVVFTTFHQAKGRERKIVFVFGFDESYFTMYAREKNKMICPSELYVAVTRASEILFVVEDYKHQPLSFLKKTPSVMKKYAFIEYIDNKPDKKKDIQQKPENKGQSHKISVREMTMYLSEVTMSLLSPIINILFVKTQEATPETTVSIPLSVTSSSGLTEDVSDLNGIVIPAMYEENTTLTISSIEKTINELSKESKNVLIKKKLSELSACREKSIESYLLKGNIFIALTENIYSKLNQIEKYNWLSGSMIFTCHSNLKNNVKPDAKYEQVIGIDCKNYYTYIHDLYGEINISGRLDAFDSKTVWEFKCVSSLHMEHFLQLTIYAWLWERCMKKTYGIKDYKILNIRTGEMYTMKYQEQFVDEIIELILVNKYDQKFKHNDGEFIDINSKISEKYKLNLKKVFDVSDSSESDSQ